MKKYYSIKYLIIFFASAILGFNIPNILSFVKLFVHFWLYLIDGKINFSAFDIPLIDYSVSLLLLLTLLLYAIFSKRQIFNQRFNLLTASLTFISIILIAAPFVTTSHPDFYNDIKLTQFLPPLNSIKSIELIDQNKNANEFWKEKSGVLNFPSSDKIIFFDSAEINKNKIIIYKGEINKSYSLNEIVSKRDAPEIKTHYFLLGTDHLGRDIFSRLIYGGRVSIFISFFAVVLASLIGISLGFLSGFRGGVIDIIINRISEVFLTFPIIYLIILVISLFGNTVFSVILVLGLSGWMPLFKIIRSEVSAIKKKDFFITSLRLGLSKYSLLVKEILPLIISPIIVNIVLQFGNVILTESALSFLGLGIATEFPTWGAMINLGQEYLSRAWWIFSIPSAALVVSLIIIESCGKHLEKLLIPFKANDK